MAPSKWDDDDSDTSSAATGSSPPPPVVLRRSKFDDEEADIDILDSWDAAEDSEVEREKAKKEAEAKAAADAAAKAKKKSHAQRVEERREENRRKREENSNYSDEAEDETSKRARLRLEEKEGDLKHAADLFGDIADIGDIDDRPIQDPKPLPKAAPPVEAPKIVDEDLFANIGVNPNRANTKAVVNIVDPDNAANAIDLASLKLFNPAGLPAFTNLRTTLAPLLLQNAKKPQYAVFMQEFVKAVCRDMPSDQIKKVASGLTTLSNEKMKEEKAAEKGGKKSKASKTKSTLNASRDTILKADVLAYDDGLDDGDFM